MKNTMIRSVNPTEHQIQCAIFEWAHINYIPDTNLKISDYLIKITNEGTGSIFRGVKSKKEGLKKGVSDIFFSYPFYKIVKAACNCCFDNIDKSGLWIEVKTKNGKLSKLQKEWIDKMNACGYEALVVRSVGQGIQAIKDYLWMK